TLYWRAGNVTLRPSPRFVSQTEKPISFRPSSGPSLKCSSASASFPGGLPRSFGVILIVIVVSPSASFAVSGSRDVRFLHPQEEPPRGPRRHPWVAQPVCACTACH